MDTPPRITSRQNPRVKDAVRLRTGRGRQRQGRFLVDGPREIVRAVAAGIRCVEAFVCETLYDPKTTPAVLETLRAAGAELLPVDSEHNAIFQCMPDDFRAGNSATAVRRIFLTCSGGPFRAATPESLAAVTPEQACAHPNWVMGRKISVDSATLMNKGLELIEAGWLFGVTPDQVEIVIHPQSVIHSLVEYVDGSVLAQLGNPDMRTPIAHALAWPDRIESGVKSLNLLEVARLDFSPPDMERFPCLRLAYEAARGGGTMPAILNAANEVAVQAFLDRRIGFTDIPRVIEHTLSSLPASRDVQLDAVLSSDLRARDVASSFIAAREPRVGQGVS